MKEEPEGDDGTSKNLVSQRKIFVSFSDLHLTTRLGLPCGLDLVDDILAKVDPDSIDLNLWTMTELTDIVRHFEYNLNDIEAYLLRKMDDIQGQKASDDMFDLDEENGLKPTTGMFLCFIGLVSHFSLHYTSCIFYSRFFKI